MFKEFTKNFSYIGPDALSSTDQIRFMPFLADDFLTTFSPFCVFQPL